MRTDAADDLIAANPGLMVLVSALTSRPVPAELAGERAALAMFRQVMAARPSRPGLARRPRLLRPAWRGAWVGGASVLVFSASFAAAGYAAVLPAPVQHAVHRLLGFAGLPDSGGRQPHGATPVVTSPGSAKTPAHGDGRTGQARARRPGGQNPRQSRGPHHSRGPHNPSGTAPIGPIGVTVAAAGNGTTRILTVTCPPADRGDLAELQVLSGGQWQELHAKLLNQSASVTFALTAKKTSVSYRAVLLGNSGQGRVVSQVITVPPHEGKGNGKSKSGGYKAGKGGGA